MGIPPTDAVKPVSPVARISLLVFAMLFPTCMASLYFVFLSGNDGKPNIWQQAAYSGGKIIQFAFPLAFVWLIDRRFPRPGKPNFAGLGLGLAFGVAVAGAMLALYYGVFADTWLFAETGPRVQRKLGEVNMLSPAKYLLMAVGIIAVHSLAEEYYWRWFAFEQSKRLVGVPLAMAVSSLAFMGHHVLVLNEYLPGRFWIAVVPFSLAIAVGGAFWAWLFARTRTIYSSWLSHAIVDGAIFIIGWDMLQRAGW